MRFGTSLLLGLVALGATAVRADIIPVLSGSPTAVAGGFRYDYTADVTVMQRVETNDFFTIFDFGPATNITTPANWVGSQSLLGSTPASVIAADDPAVQNLTFRYTGTATIGDGSAAVPLGTFSAVSPFGTVRLDNFAAEATKAGGAATGTKISNVGFVEAPNLSTAIPLPAAAVMFPLGALVAGACTRKFRK